MRTTKSCPKCRETLLIDAQSCECGWVLKRADKPIEMPEYIACARAGCARSAIVKVKTKTGWARFCEPHYLAYHTAEADRQFGALGLTRWPDESRADHRRRVFDYIRLMAKPKRFADAAPQQEAA